MLEGFVAVTTIVKSDGVLEPPSSFTTSLIILRDVVPGLRSSFVMVQIRTAFGVAIPLHSVEKLDV